MARCCNCNTEIGYLAYMAGTLRWGLSRLDPNSLEVFTCPHCGVECRPCLARSLIPYVVFAPCIALCVYCLIDSLAGGWTAIPIVGGFLSFVVCHWLWWKFVCRLEETHDSSE